MKILQALTVGGAMIDTIAIIDNEHIERMSMANADRSFLLLEEGRKTEAIEVSTHTGGGAINAAVAMARLGLEVAVLSKTGKDARGQMLIERLACERVSTRWMVTTSEAATGASVLISSHDKDAAIFTFRGANGLLDPGDVPAEAFRVDLVYVSTLSNRSAGCFPLIVERAKAAGAYVVVNPGIRQLSARMAEFRGTLANLDLLILNRAEAEVLLPLLVAEHGEGGPRLAMNSDEETPRLEATGLSGGGYKMSLAGFMGALRLSGPRSIAVTDSQGGSFVSTEDKIYYCPIVKRAVVGTAGAGDAFGATFASFIIQGFDVEIALRFAAANAACVVGHVDTQSGLQTRQALEMLMASDLGSLPVRKWVSPPAMRGDAARA